MKAEYINPFITSLANTFSTMLGCEVQRGAPTLKNGSHTLYEVNGIIGMSGKALGTVVVSLSRSVALQATGALLMCEPPTEVDAEVADAVGEITNMVAGSAKAQLEELSLSIGLPSVVIGRQQEIRFPSDATPILVPFETKWGSLSLEVGLEPCPEPALA